MLETPVSSRAGDACLGQDTGHHRLCRDLTLPDAACLSAQIEVVKCRAQVESGSGAKLGSFKIAQMIAKKEGLRGFYIGGLMTAIHDGISSGIFFWSCE